MNGKIISVSSVKGGVGKTTILLNLAGIYCELGKRVLIIDMDLFSGGIAISLDIKNTKDIFMLVDSMANNRFTELSKYVTSYNSNIDVLAAPRDPREAMKVDSRYIPLIFDAAKKEYDVVLVDTSHVLNDINLTILDYSYMSLFIVTNDSNIKMPNLVGYSRAEAENLLKLLNIDYEIEGYGYITEQSIKENEEISGKVVLKLKNKGYIESIKESENNK